MIFLQWVFAALCLLVAIWISILNWIVFWKRHILSLTSPSWIPLLGGVLGSLAILIMPLRQGKPWVWIPLLLDWGSVPGLGYSLFVHMVRNRRQ